MFCLNVEIPLYCVKLNGWRRKENYLCTQPQVWWAPVGGQRVHCSHNQGSHSRTHGCEDEVALGGNNDSQCQ